MSSYIQSYGDLASQFALSVDLVDDGILNDFRDVLYEFLEEHLDVHFVEEMHQSSRRIEGKKHASLEMVWSRCRDGKDVEPVDELVKEESGAYKGQSAFAFDRNKPMWIVSASEGPLRDTTEYVDLWSTSEPIPKYWDYADFETRTSILVPIKKGGRRFGVLNIESARTLPCLEWIQRDIKSFAEALGRLHDLSDATQLRAKNTRSAISRLRTASSRANVVLNPRPFIFVGYAAESNDDVMSIVFEVLEDYSDKFEIVDWKKVNDVGSITEDIRRKINEAECGVLYLSRITTDGGHADSANVLFEAGMFHGLSDDPVGPPRRWIPIREAGSEVPFDFVTDRILKVPRSKNGEINEQKMRNKLRGMLSSVLGPSDG